MIEHCALSFLLGGRYFMYKAVIFDMDGVLIKSEEFYFERRMEFFKKIGVKPDSTDIKDYIGASNKEVWQHLVADEKKRTLLREEANQSIADMLKRETSDTLDKVLYELSSQMKNAYSRSDA